MSHRPVGVFLLILLSGCVESGGMSRQEVDSILRSASQPPPPAPAPPVPQPFSEKQAVQAIQQMQPPAPSGTEWYGGKRAQDLHAEYQQNAEEQRRLYEERRRIAEQNASAQRSASSAKKADADCRAARSNARLLRDAERIGSEGVSRLTRSERAAAIAENERFIAQNCRR